MAAAAFEPLEAARQPGRDKIADRLINIDENVIYRCSERPPAIASVAVRASIRFNELLFHRWPSVYPHPRLPTRNVEEPDFSNSASRVSASGFWMSLVAADQRMMPMEPWVSMPRDSAISRAPASSVRNQSGFVSSARARAWASPPCNNPACCHSVARCWATVDRVCKGV